MMNLNDIPLEINGGTIISNDNITCRNTKGNPVVNRTRWIHNREMPLLTGHSGFTTERHRC